jgi:hypothetical protein
VAKLPKAATAAVRKLITARADVNLPTTMVRRHCWAAYASDLK